MGDEGRVSGARRLFRFGIGATELASERLIAALQALDATLPDAAAEGDASGPIEPHHALLGALSALPAWTRATLARGLAPARDRIARGNRLLTRLPGARRARSRYEVWLKRAEAQILRWALAGRREELAGRALAAHAIRTATRELVSAVAESPELKRVIAEQSESLGASAIAELRGGAARADALAERVTRRFLRGPGNGRPGVDGAPHYRTDGALESPIRAPPGERRFVGRRRNVSSSTARGSAPTTGC